MDAPFLLFDGGDVCLFRTMDALASYVESPDTTSYLATDSKGAVIRLTPATPMQGGLYGVVSVLPVTATPTKEVIEEWQFRQLLQQFLHQVACDVDDDGVTVDELVRQIESRIGYTS